MKSFPKLTLVIECLLLGFLASCSSNEEPAVPTTQSEKQQIIDMFTAEGFVVVENDENVKPDYVLSSENAEEFLAKWKEAKNSIKANSETLSRTTKATIPWHKTITGTIAQYSFEYKGINVYFEAAANMPSNAKIDRDNVRVYFTYTSYPLTETEVDIKSMITWASGYNHIFVDVYAKITLNFQGVTLYQGTKLVNVIFVVDFAQEKVFVKQDK